MKVYTVLVTFFHSSGKSTFARPFASQQSADDFIAEINVTPAWNLCGFDSQEEAEEEGFTGFDKAPDFEFQVDDI
jgi:hypothetical protein